MYVHFKKLRISSKFQLFFFNYEQEVKYWDKYSVIGETLNRTIREWIICVMQMYSSVGLPKRWWGVPAFFILEVGQISF